MKIKKKTQQQVQEQFTKELNKLLLKYNFTLTPTIQVVNNNVSNEKENTDNN